MNVTIFIEADDCEVQLRYVDVAQLKSCLDKMSEQIVDYMDNHYPATDNISIMVRRGLDRKLWPVMDD